MEIDPPSWPSLVPGTDTRHPTRGRRWAPGREDRAVEHARRRRRVPRHSSVREGAPL